MSKAERPRAAASLHAFLVPGMLNTTIPEGLELLPASCDEMQESAVLCRRLHERLTYLRQQVEDRPLATRLQRSTIVKYGACVGDCIRLLAKYAQKTDLLGRLAGNRRLLEEIACLHQRLDSFFVLAQLVTKPEMTLWSKEWQNDLKAQHHLFSQAWALWTEEFERLPTHQRRSAVDEESILEIKYELLTQEQKAADHKTLLQDVMTFLVPLATSGHDILMPQNGIPSWFIPRDDVVYQQQHFALGGSGAMHRGSRKSVNAGKGIKVVVKCLYSGSDHTQAALVREATLWSQLNHPNVLKLVGACHVGKPLFIATEDAGQSCNFMQFFNSREANKQKIWSLFAEVAEGLAYLHCNGIIHNNLKCSNLLVFATDGKAKLIDFGSSITVKSQEAPERPAIPSPWTAPELLVISGGESRRPDVRSDIYSLVGAGAVHVCSQSTIATIVDRRNQKPERSVGQLERVVDYKGLRLLLVIEPYREPLLQRMRHKILPDTPVYSLRKHCATNSIVIGAARNNSVPWTHDHALLAKRTPFETRKKWNCGVVT